MDNVTTLPKLFTQPIAPSKSPVSVTRHLIVATLFIATLCGTATAQQLSPAGARQTDGVVGVDAVRYRYLFENARFTTPRQEIVCDGAGRGEFSFKRKDEEEITLPLQLSATLRGQIEALFEQAGFLASTEDYQYKKDFSHLGTTTIALTRGGRERMVKFNYTVNPQMSRLADLFRNIATQETRVFEMQTVLKTDPISMPAQMRLLDGELRGNHLADPQALVPFLSSLRGDEAIPLIARNDAVRFLKQIQKSK